MRSLIASVGRPRWCLPERIGEVLEELAVGRQQHARVTRLDPLLVGLHRTVEAKKSGSRPNASAKMRLRSASPSPRVRSPSRVASALMMVPRDRLWRDAVGGTGSLGAELGCLALTLGAHAVEDVLGVLLRQVRALDADIHHLEAELLAFLVHLLGDALISTSRLSRTTSWKVDPPSTRRKADSMIAAEPRAHHALVPHRLIEQQRNW